nr:MAG TPA: hypothetical protein [Caudoviricetes sp.]
MTIGNPPSNPLHPKGSGGDFLSPLLSHDMRGGYTKSSLKHKFNCYLYMITKMFLSCII